MNHTHINPVVLRVYNEDRKGATAFFRNRPFLNTFTDLLHRLPGDECSLLIHACSIGAEPYSLAFWWMNRFGKSGKRLKIYASDIDNSFLDYAKQGIYPLDILAGMSAEEQSWFKHSVSSVSVPDDIKALVTFMPAMSFNDGVQAKQFDAGMIMNALTYVNPSLQAQAIKHLSANVRHLIALTAFHPDSIKQDIENIGFTPHPDNIEQIHNGWGNRVSNNIIHPTSAEYSWRLPPYDINIPDYQYRLCSIFKRKNEADVN